VHVRFDSTVTKVVAAVAAVAYVQTENRRQVVVVNDQTTMDELHSTDKVVGTTQRHWGEVRKRWQKVPRWPKKEAERLENGLVSG
jgi:hypothetical protein